MKRLRQLAALVALIGIGFGAVGCNEAGTSFEGNNGSQNSETPAPQPEPPSDDGEVDLSELNQQLDEMEKTMAEVELRINTFSALTLAVGGNQQSVSSELRKIFSKLTEAVGKVYAKADELRAEVDERVAKLDPMNPLHLVVLIKLQDVMVYLDELDSRLDEATNRLVVKVDELVAKVEKEISEMDQRNPLTWAVLILWQQVKFEFMTFRADLVELIGS